MFYHCHFEVPVHGDIKKLAEVWSIYIIFKFSVDDALNEQGANSTVLCP